MTIRPFRPSDAPALAALHRAAILATGAFYTKEERESWAAGLRAEGYVSIYAGAERCLVACDAEDVPIGFCSYAGNAIMGLYVHLDHQREGIGGRLLREAEAELVAHRDPPVLHVEASLSAVRFYEANGYAVTGTSAYATRGGLSLASTRLEKRPASTPPHPSPI